MEEGELFPARLGIVNEGRHELMNELRYRLKVGILVITTRLVRIIRSSFDFIKHSMEARNSLFIAKSR